MRGWEKDRHSASHYLRPPFPFEPFILPLLPRMHSFPCIHLFTRVQEEHPSGGSQVPMAELQHNMKLLVDLCEADIQKLDARLRWAGMGLGWGEEERRGGEAVAGGGGQGKGVRTLIHTHAHARTHTHTHTHTDRHHAHILHTFAGMSRTRPRWSLGIGSGWSRRRGGSVRRYPGCSQCCRWWKSARHQVGLRERQNYGIPCSTFAQP